LTIFEDLTVAENIYPYSVFKTGAGLIDKKRMLSKSAEDLSLFNLDIDPAEKIANIPLAEQRIIEILRAIGLKRKLIILDEPTSGLSESEVRILISLIKKLRTEGITILYISHRIPEVLELSDRITILKDGNYVSTINNEKVDEARLIQLMVGREVDLLYTKKESTDYIKREEFLVMEGVARGSFIRDISFTVHRNEILGIFGLEGSGVEKLSQVLFGLDSFDSGSVEINGKKISKSDTQEMIRSGFIYLNNNRKKAGLFFDMSSGDNMACPVLERISNRQFLKKKDIQQYTEGFIKRFNIIIPSAKTRPKNLSGGNQQKLMFSICMGTTPQCVILNDPTRGIDVGAKAEIHKFILDLPKNDTSVVVFSSELPELISLCDRVIVMRNNTVVRELAGDDIDEESIMTLAAGSKNT
jgi:ABC-type sugar transport system ATPase subunit